MRSAHRDLSATAAIRTAAMELFAERGFSAVTVRDIAESAGVSAPLVMHHYGSKEGLRSAVDDRALAVVEQLFAMTEQLGDQGGDDGRDAAALTSPFADLLEREPVVTTYLRRLLVDGGPQAEALFRRLYEVTVTGLTALREAGILRATEDDEVLAAFLLVNDLGAVILREQVRAVVGVDPLARPGIVRWTRTLFDVYGAAVMPAVGREGGRTTDE